MLAYRRTTSCIIDTFRSRLLLSSLECSYTWSYQQPAFSPSWLLLLLLHPFTTFTPKLVVSVVTKHRGLTADLKCFFFLFLFPFFSHAGRLCMYGGERSQGWSSADCCRIFTAKKKKKKSGWTKKNLVESHLTKKICLKITHQNHNAWEASYFYGVFWFFFAFLTTMER